VNVRILPAVPDDAVSPLNLKVVSGHGHLTVIFTGPEVLLLAVVSVSELTVAVLLMEGQLPVEVFAVRVMDFVACGAMVPKLQVSVVPPATGEAGEQSALSVPPTAQVSPTGKTSVRTTWVELAGPLAVTVMP
jgi:hypothetical protein